MMMPELYWVDTPWPGRLAIMPRPRGGDWLEDEAAGWRQAVVQVVVSLLTAAEVVELELDREASVVRRAGLEFVSFPIEDRQVPDSRQEARTLIALLGERLEQGKNVAIHCRQGVGRAGLIAASVLVLGGEASGDVLKMLTKARGCKVPETPEQQAWVEAFARGSNPELRRA
jgi:protein-tyrosine phosphatase